MLQPPENAYFMFKYPLQTVTFPVPARTLSCFQ